MESRKIMLLASLVWLVATLAVPAFAQGGSVSRIFSGAAPAPPAAQRDLDSAAIDKALAAAQSDLDAIQGSPGATLGAPPGTPASEIADRLAMVRQLPMLFQQQRDLLDRAESARQQRVDAERALAEWSGFGTPPPYSVLFVDGLRDNVANANAQVASGEARRALFERFGAEIGGKVKASQTEARLATEAAQALRVNLPAGSSPRLEPTSCSRQRISIASTPSSTSATARSIAP
jgi:hypothetical protein